MSYVREGYANATTGKPSQESKLKVGPKVPKTDFCGAGGAKKAPHRVGKR